MAEPWALVCDPGIDDALALATLAGLGAVPDLIVSEPGNVSGAVAARNAAGLVALLGLDVPVRAFRGTHPAAGRPGRGTRHGDDGLGGVAHRLPRAPFPPALADAELPGSALVTGSLAAIATARAQTYDRIVWMGGSRGGGNITAEAEFNAWCAPASADEVLQAWAAVTSVVPLDVTRRVGLDPDDLTDGRTASLLADALRVRASAPVMTPLPPWPGSAPTCSSGTGFRCAAKSTMTVAGRFWSRDGGRPAWRWTWMSQPSAP